MAEVNELDAIMNNAEQEVTQGGIKSMTEFWSAPKAKSVDPEAKAKRQAERKKLEQLHKKTCEDVSVAAQQQPVDMSIIEAHWKKNAQLICFITANDKHQNIAATLIPVKNNQRELADNAPDDIKTAFLKNPSGVPSEWIKASYEIKVCEYKPDNVVGVIARIPAYLKDCSVMDYVKSVTLEKAKKALSNGDNSVATEVMEIEKFVKILTLVGGSIMEAPETAPENGKPGEVKILYGQQNINAVSNKGILKDPYMVFAKKIVKVGQGNKTPMHNRNYFPLTTYETVDITKGMDEATVTDLNRYTFENLFTPAKNSKQVGTKHNNLVDNDRVHITRKGEDITSNYITNGASRIDLTVTAFYDKTQARPSVQLPLKRRNPKPDGTLGAPQFVKYNCTLEDKMADPEYHAKSSLGRSEFAHIVEVVGEELLAPAVLKEKFKRSGGTGSVSKYLGADIARDLFIVKLRGGLDNYEISGLTFND